jgi:prophage tail gpP-like protein
MADFAERFGEIDDRVRITLGEETNVDICESYDVYVSVLTQPASFSLTLGLSDGLIDILSKYKPNVPFKLHIGDVLQQSGRIDGRSVTSNARSGTKVSINGRDNLSALHDTYIDAEKSYLDATYAGLTRQMLAEVGLSKYPLHTSNQANRKIMTGVPVRVMSEPDQTVTTEDIVETVIASADNRTTTIHRTVRARLGFRRYDFLRKELDRVGLFLWCSAKGEFVLSQPNAKQAPSYKIFRKIGLGSNVIDAEFTDDSVPRYSECLVIGRGGGKKKGRAKALGRAVDPEMQQLGFDRALTVRDSKAIDHRTADTIALRKLAEGRRRGWRLKYTMAGHSTPSLVGGGRAVWAPDTVVDVDDELFGIKGQYWISDVHHHRSMGGSRSTLTLMRMNDLIFGTDDE